MLSRISVIGCGRVGRSVVFLLCQRDGTSLEINLVDPELNPGSFEDLCHAHALRPHRLLNNSEEALEAADVIFHCAGPEVPPGQSRLSVTRASRELTEAIFTPLDLSKSEPLVIVLSNPVDLIAQQVQEVTGLPSERVLGTGTMLDSHRFNVLLEREFDLEPGDSKCYLLGEHGDSCLLWKSGSLVRGRPVSELLSPAQLEDLLSLTKQQAAYIKSYQGATYYGVASCAVSILDLYHQPQASLQSVGALTPRWLQKELGLSRRLYLGLPVKLGQGDCRVEKFLLSEPEKAALLHSAECLFKG